MTSRRKTPHWTDPDVRDALPRDQDDIIEQRRRNKPMVECSLPEGFRLVTPTAKQYWYKGQLTWCFELGWAPVDRKGNRGEDQHKHVARYIWTVPDELQLCWALSDFMKELADKDVRLGSLKEQEPRPLRNKVIPMHPWMRASAMFALFFFFTPVPCTKVSGVDRQSGEMRERWIDKSGNVCGLVWLGRGDGWYAAPKAGALELFPTQAAAESYMEAGYCTSK